MPQTRAEKAADKEAGVIVASLARAGSAAVDQALSEVVESLACEAVRTWEEERPLAPLGSVPLVDARGG